MIHFITQEYRVQFSIPLQGKANLYYRTISGVLTAGENVIAEDFSTVNVRLGKLQNDVDLLSATFKTEDFDFVRSTKLNDNGSFAFENLHNGNYIIAPSEGFIFAVDTFAIVTIDGKDIKQLNKTIERSPFENYF